MVLALTHGDGTLTVRPISAYAQEGPSVWKMNYLSPMRLAVTPIYRPFPDPRTLFVLQNIVFWWVIPAAYGLVRSESRSNGAALSAAGLVPLTPLFWPLVWNDFRELQLAAPFVLWAVRGFRERSVGWAALGTAGMLACRQEFAVLAATFAILPPRRPESLTTSLRWRRAIVLVGLGWFLLGFFGYLSVMVGRGAPDTYIDQYLDPKASVGTTLRTSAEVLILGMGCWGMLMGLAPAAAPGLALDLGPVRRPMGVGIPRDVPLARRPIRNADGLHRPGRGPDRLLAVGGVVAHRAARDGPGSRWPGSPRPRLGSSVSATSPAGSPPSRAPIDRDEAQEIWAWIGQVGPDDAVIADYRVCAPLSLRRWLYGNILDVNLPPGFPRLGPEFRWLFVRNDWPWLNVLLHQGFDVVYRGRYLTIAHRRTINLVGNFGIFPVSREQIFRDKMSTSGNQVRVAFRSPGGSTVVAFSAAGRSPRGSNHDERAGCVARSHRGLGSLMDPMTR